MATDKHALIFTVPAHKMHAWFAAHGLVPEGSKLTGVSYNFDYDEFTFRVEHPTFPRVLEGAMPQRKRLEYGG